MKAFDDTWRWDQAAAQAYQGVVERGGKVSQAIQAFRTFLGESDMLAYLSMMAPRLVELQRALKPTGSIYLHCDPTASHYLKMLMDAVMRPEQFLNEIIWRRTGTHSSARRWGPVHDIILYYANPQGRHVWNRLYVPLADTHRKRHYHRVDATGRVFTHGELTVPRRSATVGVVSPGMALMSPRSVATGSPLSRSLMISRWSGGTISLLRGNGRD